MRNHGAILIADSDGPTADIMMEILHDEGYAVIAAHNRALASVADAPPALALLDDQLAGLSAAHLLAHIARRHLVRVPIITTTTNPAVAAQDSWQVIAKPFSLDDLVAHGTHYVLRTELAQ